MLGRPNMGGLKMWAQMIISECCFDYRQQLCNTCTYEHAMAFQCFDFSPLFCAR